jgi:ParB-like chromosome segregation protein Spo0J
VADRTKTVIPLQVPALRRLVPVPRNSRTVADDRDRVAVPAFGVASHDDANNYDVLPAHSLPEVESLRASLRVSGIITPLVVDEAQNIIDGRKRAQLWQELGYRADDVFKQAAVLLGLTAEQKKTLRIELNFARRRSLPNAKQRRESIALLLQSTCLPENAIAAMFGTSQPTVNRVKQRLIRDGVLPADRRTVGRDQKSRRSTYIRTTVKNKNHLAKIAANVMAEFDDLPKGTVDARTLLSKAATLQRRRRLAGIPCHRSLRYQRMLAQPCDFRELDKVLAPRSVDLILTDPLWNDDPATRKDLADLGTFAVKWLRPRGVLAAWMGLAGLHRLFDLWNGTPGLHYQWTFAVECWRSCEQAVRLNEIRASWKPVVVYSTAEEFRFNSFTDLIFAGAPEKEFHPMQRSRFEVKEVLERLSSPGQLVVDPFAGSGTTGLVCANTGRRFWGPSATRNTIAVPAGASRNRSAQCPERPAQC